MSDILTLHHPRRVQAHYASGSWRADTLYGLLCKHARERGACNSVRDGLRRLTWQQWLDAVDAVACALHAAGVRRGDRVCVWLPNRVEATVVFLACARNGYVCNPSLHQNYTVAEILSLLERVRATVLFAQQGYGADADRHDIFGLVRKVPTIKHVFAIPAAGRGFPANAQSFPEGEAPLHPDVDLDPDRIVYLAFTSGTTGTPKGVMHSENTLLANARAMVTDWHHDASTILLSLSPMSHHIATVGLMQTLVTGGEFVLSQLTVENRAIDWIERSGATYVMGVPTHALDVLSAARQRELKRLYHVNTFYMAGAPIPAEVARQLMALGAKPQNVYGMTENGSHNYTLPDDDLETITGTCGRACRSYEIKLWSEENRDVEVTVPGQVGEIGGRGGTLMLGYFADQAATEESFNASGWFMSGDLGMLDERGNLRVVGRVKDLIIRGGHKIHPARIEDLAYRHPTVAKAAAFGVDDARLGEKVCLAIIPSRSPAPSAQELLHHLYEAGLSKFDMPEYFLSLPAFPLTASGKVLKRELVAWVRSGRVEPQAVRWVQRD